MRKLISGFLFIGFLYLAYGLFIGQWRPHNFDSPPNSLRPSLFYDYAGAINVRTNKSSGSGHFETIVQDAQSAGLKFVITTDFNDFNPDFKRPVYLNNVLTLVGGEYGYLDARVLNLNIKSDEHLQGPGRSQMVFADILSHHNPDRPEGIFILAHPFKPGYQLNRPYPAGLDGIELINLKSVWQEAWLRSRAAFIWTAFVYPFNSELAFLRLLTSGGARELALWDKLNQKQKVMGIYGSSAEAKLKVSNDHYIKFPSYETVFSIASNHVVMRSELTGQAEQDQNKIATALRNGQFYMSLDIIESPKGFECYLQNRKNELFLMGAEVKYSDGLEYVIRLPAKPSVDFEVQVFRNGEKLLTSNSAETSYILREPGVYRSVVRLRVPMPFPDGRTWMNWIVSNPIYIR